MTEADHSEMMGEIEAGDKITVQYQDYPGQNPKDFLSGTVTNVTSYCVDFIPEDGSDDYWQAFTSRDTDRIRVYDDSATIHAYHPDRGTDDLTQIGQRAEVESDDMTDSETDPEVVTDGGQPNLPAGDDTDRPFSTEEIRDLIRGAELLRYSPGTGEHEGNVMAVFRRPDGAGIGLTMNDDSKTPDFLIGDTVASERPYVDGSGVNHAMAFILFEGRSNTTEKIVVKNTRNLGVYEVELEDEDQPEVMTDGGVSECPVCGRGHDDFEEAGDCCSPDPHIMTDGGQPVEDEEDEEEEMVDITVPKDDIAEYCCFHAIEGDEYDLCSEIRENDVDWISEVCPENVNHIESYSDGYIIAWGEFEISVVVEHIPATRHSPPETRTRSRKVMFEAKAKLGEWGDGYLRIE